MTLAINTKSVRDQGDIGKLLAPGQPRRQSLQGFDEEYSDIVDYIIRCTHRIWEEKGVGLIYTHYQHNSLIHGAGGDSYGREGVVQATLQTMSMFPNRRLYADDVIWTGNDQDGFYTSHHITSTGHNTGPGAYGPPTGRAATYRAIALCYVRENRIFEEWLLRDELSVIRQLGLDEHAIIQAQARRDLARAKPPVVHGEVERSLGQFEPYSMPPRTGEGFDVDDFVRRSVHEIWNWRMLNKMRDYYTENYECHTASDRRIYGVGDFTAFLISVLASLPDARVALDQVYWNGDEASGGYRVATRWTLHGTHTGWGLYGAPSGARVQIMGLSHHLIQGGKFVRESTLFDEFGLLRQIEAARLAG